VVGGRAGSAAIGSLLIVPRPSVAGKRLALRRGGVLDHSEHALVLIGDPTSGPEQPALELRPATAADLALVARLLEDGFGTPAHDDLVDRLDSPRDRTVSARCVFAATETKLGSKGLRSTLLYKAGGSAALRCGGLVSSYERTARAVSAWKSTSRMTARWGCTRPSALRR
jgi:hypothetical protein